MAAKQAHCDLSPSIEHSCEICGVSGLSDDSMREHTRQCHVEGSAFCPFCGMGGVDGAELLLHVNQAHLDYLTPENELMSFIDDQSPRYEPTLNFSERETSQRKIFKFLFQCGR